MIAVAACPVERKDRACFARAIAGGRIAANGAGFDRGDAQRNGLESLRSARDRRPVAAHPGQQVGRRHAFDQLWHASPRWSGSRPPPGRNLPGRTGTCRDRGRRSGDLSRARRHRADRSACGCLHGCPVRRLADCRRRLLCHGFRADASRRRQRASVRADWPPRAADDGGGSVGSN